MELLIKSNSSMTYSNLTASPTPIQAALTAPRVVFGTLSVEYSVLEGNIYAISVLNSISNIAALLIDIIALIGIIKAQNFSSGTRIFLANLTIIDLISAATLQPCTTAYLIIWLKDSSQSSINILSDVTNSLHYILTLTSFLAFVAVSVDRYMLLYQPFTYATKISTRTAIAISCLGNIGVVISYVILKLTTPDKKILRYFSIIMYISIAIMLCIHTRIMVTAMLTYRKIQQNSCSDQVQQNHLKRRRVEIKQAGVTVALFFTIITCYLPIIVINQIPQDASSDGLQRAIISHWALVLMLACPIGKQLLLCIMNKAIRAAVRRWVFLLRDPVFV